MATERTTQSDGQPIGATRSTDHVLLVALVAGLLWGAVDALRVGAGPLLSVAAATSVSGFLLGTWRCLQPLEWLSATVHATVSGALIAVGPLSVFGRMLAASTHHRPLGAATFAVVAVAVVLSCVAPTLRVFALAQGTVWETRVRVVSWIAGAMSLGFGLWCARDLHLVAALVVGLGALGLAIGLERKLALVERWRHIRLATRLTFGTLCVAVIWLASEPVAQSSGSIPLGLWALVLQN